jgi:sugar phosphate isomerase/epimerase
MDHVLSTHLFVNHRLTTAWLDKIWNAGIPAVELFCARQHLDWTDRGHVRELGHWFRDSELKVRSMHSPMYTDDVWGRSGPHSVLTITEPIKSKRNPMVDEVKRALEIAEEVPFRYLIQHMGVSGEEYDERRLDAAFTALEEISLFAKQRGVEVLLENTPNALSSAKRLNLFNQITHLNLNFCFDVGHAHIGEGIEEEFGLLKDSIRSTHIHDNNGTDDQHLFPFLSPGGSIDWGRTMDLLRSGGDRYPLLLELRELPDVAQPLELVKRVFEKLEAASARKEER